MPNFVLTYTGGDGMPETEAEQATVMEAWGAWYGTLGDSLVDGGAPLGAAKSIAPDGSVSDGSGSALTGYTIISAADVDAAIGKAKGCPVLEANGTVEVHTAFDMG